MKKVLYILIGVVLLLSCGGRKNASDSYINDMEEVVTDSMPLDSLHTRCQGSSRMGICHHLHHLMADITMGHHLTERGVLTMSMTICVASIRHRKMIWTITV